jgi:glycerol-3-phosphate dehydrogenase (NAD(P)+)
MKKEKFKTIKISILGAGSWGGTLAWLLSSNGIKVNLWTFSKKEYNSIKKSNSLLRPIKIKLNNDIFLTTDLNYIVNNSNILIIAVPTNAFKSTIKQIKKYKLKNNVTILSATKGITTDDNLRPSQILKQYFPKNPTAVLSGPNIAMDVISKAPIISVIASNNIKTAILLQKLLSSNYFRIYLNSDIDGVEIAGALKNVIALAAGMSDGFGFNISTKAALISRGLTEIARIIVKEGGKPKTLLGAAGIGDLIATCCSTNSRNYRVGFSLAKGKKLKDILKSLGQVAEGTETVKSMISLAKKHKVDVPIAQSVFNIIYRNKKPKTELKNLLGRRPPKYEIEF